MKKKGPYWFIILMSMSKRGTSHHFFFVYFMKSKAFWFERKNPIKNGVGRKFWDWRRDTGE